MLRLICELLICLGVCFTVTPVPAQPTVKGPLGEQPVATMQGKAVSVTSKVISLKLSDDNVLEFHLTRKTKFYLNGKLASLKIVETGETVTIEAIRAADGSLDAVNLKVERARPEGK